MHSFREIGENKIFGNGGLQIFGNGIFAENIRVINMKML